MPKVARCSGRLAAFKCDHSHRSSWVTHSRKGNASSALRRGDPPASVRTAREALSLTQSEVARRLRTSRRSSPARFHCGISHGQHSQ